MFKKAQAAMEFLMTYGWAILVVLAAVGALAYFGVLSPGNIMPAKCDLSPAGLDCIQTPFANSTNVVFTVTNSFGYDLNSFTINPISTDVVCSSVSIPGNNITSGETAVITLGCTGLQQGKRYKAEFSLMSLSSSGQPVASSGTITGKVI
jgi:hypothetical protein